MKPKYDPTSPFGQLDDRRLGARLESVCQTTFAAVLAIIVESHEDPCTTLSGGAFTTETLDLAIRINFVVLEDRHLDLLAFVLDLFGGVVRLLLALLGTTSEAEYQMESRFFLYIVIRKSAPILELFASEDQTLLVGGNTFLVLDLGFDIIDSIRGFNLESDGFAREGLHEDLHVS